MRKIVAVFVLALSAAFTAFAQEPAPDVPDVYEGEWNFVGIYTKDLENSVLVYKNYWSVDEKRKAVMISLVDTRNNREDDLAVLYGELKDKLCTTAILVKGEWFISTKKNTIRFANIEDKHGKIIGLRVSLKTDKGEKVRDIFYSARLLQETAT